MQYTHPIDLGLDIGSFNNVFYGKMPILLLHRMSTLLEYYLKWSAVKFDLGEILFRNCSHCIVSLVTKNCQYCSLHC